MTVCEALERIDARTTILRVELDGVAVLLGPMPVTVARMAAAGMTDRGRVVVLLEA
jgi:hypothetical protein